jgi:two-component system LytT family response regulator
MYSAIIVDDEIDQQHILNNMLLKEFPQITVKSVCSSVDEGVQKIKSLQPQLVFLDIHLPPKTGFDLLNELGNINFGVVFTTAYDTYAVKAFEVSAVDYLLKPFGIDELSRAIGRFEKDIALKDSLQCIKTLLQNLNTNTSDNIRIALPTTHGHSFVTVCDIVRCEADNNYTTFYFTDKSKKVITRLLGDCESLLGEFNFFRPHATHLINMRHVTDYLKGDKGIIKMIDGSSVELSRLRKDAFLKILHKL